MKSFKDHIKAKNAKHARVLRVLDQLLKVKGNLLMLDGWIAKTEPTNGTYYTIFDNGRWRRPVVYSMFRLLADFEAITDDYARRPELDPDEPTEEQWVEQYYQMAVQLNNKPIMSLSELETKGLTNITHYGVRRVGWS